MLKPLKANISDFVQAGEEERAAKNCCERMQGLRVRLLQTKKSGEDSSSGTDSSPNSSNGSLHGIRIPDFLFSCLTVSCYSLSVSQVSVLSVTMMKLGGVSKNRRYQQPQPYAGKADKGGSSDSLKRILSVCWLLLPE